MKNNQESKKHGGFRPGSGRKPGVSMKIQASTILKQLHRNMHKSYAELLVDELNKSIINGDTKLTADYLKFIGNKCVADKIDIDHTTAGQPLTATFKFPQEELNDWNSIPKIVTTKE
jgi:hypothetical protein